MVKTHKDKIAFFRKWLLTSLVVITLCYLVSLIAVLLVHGAFGFDMNEWGTPLSQTMMQIAGGVVIALGTGVYQKSLLKNLFRVTSSWIYSLIIGFVLAELISGLILWLLGLNRGELRFIEANPLPESVIFAGIGLLTGLLQWTILRKQFMRSGYWIAASTIGWGSFILVNALSGILLIKNLLILEILIFMSGALLYGAVTGATLTWILKVKDYQNG